MPATTPNDFIPSMEPEPHKIRRRQILAAHPEAVELTGPAPFTAVIIVAVVALQLLVAYALRDSAWWLLLLVAYVVGATANNALFVLIHECTHNLAWKGTRANRLLGILCNVPIIFPSAMSFRKYHLLHHKYQGELAFDADLPSPAEARLVGSSPWRKALWLLLFVLVEALRPMRMKKVRLMDGWTVANIVAMIAVSAAVVYWMGWQSLAYLGLSTVFGVGLHPLGARWIQEHYVVREGQETNSYYGPLNTVALNVGYHYEHHDLMNVAWHRLPKLRALAPEFYDGLYAHRSWTRLLFWFLFDRRLTLYSRVVRPTPSASEPLEQPEGTPAVAIAQQL